MHEKRILKARKRVSFLILPPSHTYSLSCTISDTRCVFIFVVQLLFNLQKADFNFVLSYLLDIFNML